MFATHALPLVLLTLAVAHAQDATAPQGANTGDRFPLRLHILAVDDLHRTQRMQPNWCAGSAPAGDTAATPCSSSGSTSLGGGEDDFSGTGRADLVTPPGTATGLNFTYEGCSRIRVAPGFHALEARWIKPGQKLQVIVANDETSDSKVRLQQCTLKVVLQDFVYLRLRNRSIIRVTQEAYARKPALRAFLSGGPESLTHRKPATTPE